MNSKFSIFVVFLVSLSDWQCAVLHVTCVPILTSHDFLPSLLHCITDDNGRWSQAESEISTPGSMGGIQSEPLHHSEALSDRLQVNNFICNVSARRVLLEHLIHTLTWLKGDIRQQPNKKNQKKTIDVNRLPYSMSSFKYFWVFKSFEQSLQKHGDMSMKIS